VESRTDESFVKAVGSRVAGCLGTLILGVGAEVAGALLNGWVLSVLWGWFLVPLGIPPILILHAIGVGVTISLLTSHGPKGKDERTSTEKMREAIAFMFMTPLVALAMGWIVHSFM
jgi:hypothetical protein